MPTLRGNIGKQVQSDRMVNVRGIKENYIIDSPRRNEIEQLHSQISVGIEHGHTEAGFNVLTDQVLDETRLAGASLADDVGMVAAVGKPQAKGLIGPPNIAGSEFDNMILKRLEWFPH